MQYYLFLLKVREDAGGPLCSLHPVEASARMLTGEFLSGCLEAIGLDIVETP